jgi:hypothetical protein
MANPLKTFNDAFDKRKAKLMKAQDGMVASNNQADYYGTPSVDNTTPYKYDYASAIATAKKQGWKEDQAGAFKKNLTDTASVTYMKSPKGEYAGVKKPKK